MRTGGPVGGTQPCNAMRTTSSRAVPADAARLRFYREAAAKEVPLTGATLVQAQAARFRVLSARKWASRYLDQIGDIEKVTRWIEKSAQREENEIARLKRGRRVLLAGLAGALAML